MSEERKSVAHSKIFSYWKDKAITADGSVVDEDGNPATVPVVEYWTEPCCWACGKRVYGLSEYKSYESNLIGSRIRMLYDYAKTRRVLERCHIVPHALGGSDEDPANMFLLCHDCHLESPDNANEKYFLRWVYKMRTEKVFSGDHIRIDVKQAMKQLAEEGAFWGKDVLSGDAEKMGEDVVLQHGGTHLPTIISSYLETCNDL